MKKDTGFRRILFAVNASEHSAAAVPVVAAIAAASHATVRVLHVWSPDDARLGRHEEVAGALEESELVDSVVDKLRAAGVAADEESAAAMSDQVATLIRERADSFDADLIAIGNRGLSELHNILVPSRTQQVLAHADRPVLAVRHTGRRVRVHTIDDFGRSSGIDHRFRRVVLALDGDSDHACAVHACIDIARPAASEVDVIHFGARDDPQIRAVVTGLATYGLKATWQRADDDKHPADEIIGAVSRAGADLLIIGARQAGAWSLFVGDVTHRVLESCPCPVIVAPLPSQAKGPCTELDSREPSHSVRSKRTDS